MKDNKIIEETIVHIEKLLNEVVNVNSKFKLYKYIIERANDNLNELNIAPGFFNLVLDSLISNVIITIAKIYEPSNRSGGSISKLINKIEQSIKSIEDERINIELIKKHRNEIEKSKDVIKNLFVWRDKQYAHYDKKYFLGENNLSEDAKLTFGDIINLIEKAGAILNDYYSVLTDKYYSIEACNFDDVKKILDMLKQYNYIRDEFIELNKNHRK